MRTLLRLSSLALCASLACGCLFPSVEQFVCESDCGTSQSATSNGGGPVGGSGGEQSGGGPPIGGGGGAPGAPCADPLGRGADGVLVDTPGDFPLYCIDSVEVSWAYYLDFINSLSFMTDQEFEGYRSPECAFVNRDFDEFTTFYGYPNVFDNAADQPKPAVGMSWCDAQIHCRWAGKDLCGDIDGVSPESASDLNRSRWVTACSHFGDFAYSYGDVYDPDICLVTTCADDYHTLADAAPNGCEGGVPGLFNMSGNVNEFTNHCVAAGGPGFEDDLCTVRGGNCNLMQYSDCEWTAQIARSFKAMGNYQAFRCCWTPPDP